ncbi:MAG: sugar transferase [Alphaproteobacteria bacterium]
MIGNHDSGTGRYGRLCDILLACFAIIFLVPLMAAVALAIKADGSGPVLRRRTRICRSGRWIQAFEFRTAAYRSREMTRVHRFLRRTRIDTLPQAINVLRGDLTFIGIDRPAFLT